MGNCIYIENVGIDFSSVNRACNTRFLSILLRVVLFNRNGMEMTDI